MLTQRIPLVASLLSLAVPVWLSATMPARRPSAAVATTLQVTNDNSQGVNVILLRNDGQQYVLGEVDRGKTRVFDVPADLMGSPGTRVLADPIDRLAGFQSEPVTLAPGHGATLLVEHGAGDALLAVH